MKVLLFLTVAVLCISQALAQAVCSNTNITSTNCGSLINNLIVTSGYKYFDLTQFAPNVDLVAVETKLSIFFASLDFSPLCSQCIANIKAFSCLTVYPSCNDTAPTPNIPCDDFICNAGLLQSCIPGVFVNGSVLFNPGLTQAAYYPIQLAFAGTSAAFVANITTLFNLIGNPLLGCTNQGSIRDFFNTQLGLIASPNTVVCNVAPMASFSAINYLTDMCPCMPFPSIGTTYCTNPEVGIGKIPAIYAVLGVTNVDFGIAMAVANQSSLLVGAGLNCTSCDASLRKFSCGTGFLQCNASAFSAIASSAFSFPCQSVGSNFIAACSLNEAYNLLVSPLNPFPNPTLANELSNAIAGALSLPVSPPLCTSQTITPDSNCGCIPLRSGDVCQPYISGVSSFLPLDYLNTTAYTQMATLGLLSNLYMANCSSCAQRITSALCHAVYPSCGVLSTALTHCTSSCVTELSGCNAQELCFVFEAQGGLSSTICGSYSSMAPAPCPSALLPPFVQGCGNQSVINMTVDSVCALYVGNSLMPLDKLDPITAASLPSIDGLIFSFSFTFCKGCQAALAELFCNMKYLKCQSYSPAQTMSISLSIPSWGCTSSLLEEYGDCAPPGVKFDSVGLSYFIGNFSSQFTINPLDPFSLTLETIFTQTNALFTAQSAPLAAINITYQCNIFKTFVGRSFFPADECPCVTLSTATLGGCAPYVNYQVAAFLNNSFIAQGIFSDPDLMNLAGLTCNDCAAKSYELACVSQFPMCITGPGTGYIAVNKSVCDNVLDTCRVKQFNTADVMALLSIAGAVDPNLRTPNITKFLSSCDYYPTNSIFFPTNYTALPPCNCSMIPPSSMCAPFVTYPIASFLANLPPTTRALVEGIAFGQSASSNCASCKNAINHNMCFAVNPMCTSTEIAVRTCQSVCTTGLSFCDSASGAQAICTTSPLSIAFSTTNCSTPSNPYSGDMTCPAPPSVASSFLPSLLFVAIAFAIRTLL